MTYNVIYFTGKLLWRRLPLVALLRGGEACTPTTRLDSNGKQNYRLTKAWSRFSDELFTGVTKDSGWKYHYLRVYTPWLSIGPLWPGWYCKESYIKGLRPSQEGISFHTTSPLHFRVNTSYKSLSPFQDSLQFPSNRPSLNMPTSPSTSTKFWYCCSCGFGPMTVANTPSCIQCHRHPHCANCTVTVGS